MPGYKIPPDNSIEAAGGLEPYVDNFFAKRQKPYTYSRDVEPLFYKKIPWTIKGRMVDITAATFKSWEARYNMEHETSSS